MIYQRKPAPNSLGVYGVAVRRPTGVAPPRNVVTAQTSPNAPGGQWWNQPSPTYPGPFVNPGCGLIGQPPCTGVNPSGPVSGFGRYGFFKKIRGAGGLGSARRMGGLRFHGFGASFGDDGDYVGWDITQTYTDTTDPYNPTPQDTSSTSSDTTTYPYGPGSTYWQTNTPGLGTGGSGSSGTPTTTSGGTSTQDWFNTGGQAAKSTLDLVGSILKTFGIGGASGTQGTGTPQAGNSMISLTVLGAVVLGAGALYLASSRKKA